MRSQCGELRLTAAEIGSVVWGTHANFNGFRVLVSLLHGILAVGTSQTLPPIIGSAAITLGIGPHCSLVFMSLLLGFPIRRGISAIQA